MVLGSTSTAQIPTNLCSSLQAKYNLTGPEALAGNDSVRQIVFTAFGNTLNQRDGIQLQSLTGSTASGGKHTILLSTSIP